MHGLKKEDHPLSTLRTALGKVSLLAPQLLARWVCTLARPRRVGNGCASLSAATKQRIF